MTKTSAVVMLLSCILSLGCLAETALPAQAVPTLESVLSSAKSREFGQTLDQVSTLDHEGHKADDTLIALLNYYLGAGPSEALAEAITKRGSRMLPSLESLRSKPPQCIKAYADLCENRNEEDIAARNEFVDRLIAAIRAGKVLRVES